MEAEQIQQKFASTLSPDTALTKFFEEHSLDSTKVLFWKFFQCWVTRECNIKAELSDEEVALFFDQLMDLVAAAYILHQADRVPNENQQEGKSHE
jgi:hypothetical protein